MGQGSTEGHKPATAVINLVTEKEKRHERQLRKFQEAIGEFRLEAAESLEDEIKET